MAPKTIAIQKAEYITLLFAKPIIFFYKLMYPFIWLLNGAAIDIENVQYETDQRE